MDSKQNQKFEIASKIRKHILGSDLAAVTFVRDYVQLGFDGPSFNVMTPITVSSPRGNAATGDDQFRNLLCAQIGKAVSDVKSGDEWIEIVFGDDTTIKLSVKDSDYAGPEAIVFHGNDNFWVVM